MHVVARIGRPHGLKGEVTVQVRTDDPQGRFVVGSAFPTEPADRGPLVLRSVRVHQGVHLLAFVGHADRAAAEALRGTRLLAPGQDETDEDADAWYEEELVGLTVVTVEGAVVGEVSGLYPREVQDLLEVRLSAGGTALIPFVEQLVPEVDPEGGRVVIDTPPGLLELGLE